MHVVAAVVYEQPLNERIRSFLRIEQLMQRFEYYVNGKTVWDTHAALSTLLELLDLFARGDLKREIMKELERQLANLSHIDGRPGIDDGLLRNTTQRHRRLVKAIHDMSGQMGGHLKTNDFLNSIKQRTSIPGGTCDFDLPAYHHWLSKPAAERHTILTQWTQPMTRVREAVETILNLIRGSATPDSVVAKRGYYEQTLGRDQPYQMIRIDLTGHPDIFPEISAGKHRFTVRFRLRKRLDVRASQTSDDIAFELYCCAL